MEIGEEGETARGWGEEGKIQGHLQTLAQRGQQKKSLNAKRSFLTASLFMARDD